MRLSTLAEERASANSSVSESSTEGATARSRVLSLRRNLLDQTERTPGLRQRAMLAKGSLSAITRVSLRLNLWSSST